MKRSFDSQDFTLWGRQALNDVTERYQSQQARLGEYLAALEGHDVTDKVGREITAYVAAKFAFIYGADSERSPKGKSYFANRDEMGAAYTVMHDAFTVLAAAWEQKDLPLGMFTTVCSALDSTVRAMAQEVLDQEKTNKKGNR